MPSVIVFQLPVERPEQPAPAPGFHELLLLRPPISVCSVLARASAERGFLDRIRWRRNEDGTFNLIRRRKK